MNKQEVYEFLKNRGIWYEITEHKAVFTMEDLRDVNLPYPESNAKNVFVRDSKKRNYYLITLKGEKKINLKEFREKVGSSQLSFASEADLMSILGLSPGSVSPLGILNDKECKVQYFLDKELTENSGIMGMHPNENTASIWLKAEDLLDIIKEHGNSASVISI
ncbi:prolyl-tRNA synthetase associated domain-containing protein [Criibacterium bergeronii]|uniref:Prolyl-tRNA synthetase associated domain-containing protein n=1 Tax=Criibacterium bergeronii TaxID=1871336 RepID=A0A552V548_9FIRM|nr:prolyl-tRNA synthetase associated domain-containing protein [Criibacterium bergeronii]TRW25578.1 prolyl-tRNA synthetase associated domain-containing protein [Criibacterium bergeronii]